MSIAPADGPTHRGGLDVREPASGSRPFQIELAKANRRALRARRVAIGVALLLVGLAMLSADEGASAFSSQPNVLPDPALQGPVALSALPDLDRCYAFPLLEQRDVAGFGGAAETGARLSWTTSGFIEQDAFYVTELSFPRLATFSPGGYVEDAAFESVLPWFVYPRWSNDGQGSYEGLVLIDMLDTHSSELLLVDESWQVEDRFSTWGERLASSDGEDVVMLDAFRAVPVPGGVVVNGDFMTPEAFAARRGAEYWNAFTFLDRGEHRGAYLPLALHRPSGSLDAEREREAQRDLKERFFARDFSYMASLGETAFALIPEQRQPWIGRIDTQAGEIQALPGFPADLRVPAIAIRNEEGRLLPGVERVQSVYEQVEAAQNMPIGLYSWRDRLFILSKSRADERTGSTLWQFAEISPEDGRDLDNRIILPANSEHISVAIGQEFIGIIEKGGINRLAKSTFPWAELYRPTLGAVLFHADTWLSGHRDAPAPPGCQLVQPGSGPA